MRIGDPWNGAGEPMPRHHPRAPLARPGRVGALVGGAFAVLSVLLLIPPSGAAAIPLITHSAPYRGSTSNPSDSSSSTRCANAEILQGAVWHPRYGTAGLALHSTAGKCAAGTGLGTRSATTDSSIQITIPLTLPGGRHSVEANWTWSAAGREGILVGGACAAPKLVHGTGYSSCGAQAYVTLYVTVWLVDLTRGTNFGSSVGGLGWSASSSSYNITDCYQGRCVYTNSSTASSSGGFTLSLAKSYVINGTFVSSDSYALETYLSGTASAANFGYPGSSEHAYLNMATLGRSATLSSIAVL